MKVTLPERWVQWAKSPKSLWASGILLVTALQAGVLNAALGDHPWLTLFQGFWGGFCFAQLLHLLWQRKLMREASGEQQ
jgi:hypothetical protein